MSSVAWYRLTYILKCPDYSCYSVADQIRMGPLPSRTLLTDNAMLNVITLSYNLYFNVFHYSSTKIFPWESIKYIYPSTYPSTTPIL